MASKNIAVLMGGWSAEREVSLVSGQAVAKAASSLGHQVRLIDVRRDLPALLAALSPRPDVVFNALHGKGGEDGTIQAVLDMLQIPYTHSGLLASAVAMDKPMAKEIVSQHHVRVPKGKVGTVAAALAGELMPRPFIIKPCNEGSSVGVHIIREQDNRLELSGYQRDDSVLVEEFVPGRELTVGVMGDKALAVTEIRFTSNLFDYTAKYTSGHAEHICPAQIPDDVYQAAMAMALTAHQALGCTGVSRSDFRYDDQQAGTDGLYWLEINTQPGMTPLSLVPEQAQYLGMSYAELVDWMLEHPLCHAA